MDGDGFLSRHVGQTRNGSFDKERPGVFFFFQNMSSNKRSILGMLF
jgi:hypothetical protein